MEAYLSEQLPPSPSSEARGSGVDRLGRLHRSVIAGSGRVRDLLCSLEPGARLLTAGSGASQEPAILSLVAVHADHFTLAAPEFQAEGQPQIYLQFEVGDVRYFFASEPIRGGGDEPLEVALPDAIYESERREDLRFLPGEEGTVPRQVRLTSGDARATAAVSDWSRQGVGVELPASELKPLRFPLRIRHIGGEQGGWEGFADLRHREDLGRSVRLGLAVSAVPDGRSVRVERFDARSRAWRRLAVDDAPRRRAGRDAFAGGVRLVEYANDLGQPIRALVNATSSFHGGTAVVIPPSWGGTKERTLGLAATLVETFERAGEPLVVVRFDGTHRGGESWIAPGFRGEGDESLGFTFSQAVRDIRATFDYVEREDTYHARKVVLVTFSLGAIEGRRAMAEHAPDALAGWVSVVGVPDLQSGMRSVSGGVDYVLGWLRGMRWGIQELLGVRADIDRTGQDALDHDLVYFDDARRDVAAIRSPITWLHGRHDGWVELERVRRLLSAGDAGERKLVELPCGHQMRSSRDAMRTFETVAAEVAEMALGRPVETKSPDIRTFARLERTERDRLKHGRVDLRAFWSEYLLGAKQGLGVELMTATRAYRTFMEDQVRLLRVPDGGRVLDLGAGIGDFALGVSRRLPHASAWRVIAVDFVAQALQRAAQRLAERSSPGAVAALRPLLAQLDFASGRSHVPIADDSVDAVVASLLLSYLAIPSNVLEEARRVLRPGGCLVVSTMRRDADISKLYTDGVAELPPDRVRAHFGAVSDAEVEVFQRAFLNNAARLLRLEEEGRFRFWDEEEFRRLVAEAGFEDVEVVRSFGDPAQALILRARAPF